MDGKLQEVFTYQMQISILKAKLYHLYYFILFIIYVIDSILKHTVLLKCIIFSCGKKLIIVWMSLCLSPSGCVFLCEWVYGCKCIVVIVVISVQYIFSLNCSTSSLLFSTDGFSKLFITFYNIVQHASNLSLVATRQPVNFYWLLVWQNWQKVWERWVLCVFTVYDWIIQGKYSAGKWLQKNL